MFNDFTDWISGCCILIKSEIVKKTGLLDEKFFAYFEDVDWSLRIKNEGYLLGIDYRSIIYHHESGSSTKDNNKKEGNLSAKVHYFNIRNHILFLKKHKNLFNLFGIVFFQVLKITSFKTFSRRFRFNKLSMVFKGIKHSLNNK